EAELPPTREAFDLMFVIKEQIASRKNPIEDRGIQVRIDCPDIQIQGDRSRLATALSNLIDNAVQYNKLGGQIHISADTRNGTLNLVVSDTGNRTNDDKWLFPGCDRLGQRCVRRLVGKVLLTGEEAQKRTTLKSAMISYSAAQHGITGLQRIEDRTLGDRSLDLEYDFGADVRQISEMIGKDQANHIKRASVPPPTALPA